MDNGTRTAAAATEVATLVRTINAGPATPQAGAAAVARLVELVDFHELGAEAYAEGDMAAPALSAVVMAALWGRPVGDPGGRDLMRAFTRGYAETATLCDDEDAIDDAAVLDDDEPNREPSAALEESWDAREAWIATA